jgi:thiol-disulfide isomerase/thioredoxin
MRKFYQFILLAIIVLFVSCSDKQSGYEIKGTVPDSNLDGYWVFMTDYNKGEIVDSTLVADGKFVFRGSINGSAVRNLNLRYLSVDLIVEEGTITLDISDPYSPKGTPLTEELNKFNLENEQIVNEARAVMSGLDESLGEDERVSVLDSLADDLYGKLNKIPPVYLENHPDDALGDIIYYVWLENLEPTVENFEYSKGFVSERVLNFAPTKELMNAYEKVSSTSAGSSFVDFTIENGNMDGTQVSFSDYIGKGKYVLVDFWASWCMPCRVEIPNLKEVYAKYKGKEFEILSVAVWDKREDTLEAIKDENLPWPQIVDAQTIPSELYAIQGIPMIILFGPDGKIVLRDLRGANLKTELAKLFDK